MQQFSRTLRFVILSFISFGLSGYVQANAQGGKEPPLLLDNLTDTIGEYQGEVRLQSSDATTNRIIVPHARLILKISGDQLQLSAPSDLLGTGCNSKLSSVRELIKYPANQAEVLEAVFDFNSGDCYKKSQPNSLLVLVRRDETQGLILETLLARNPTSLEIRSQLNQKVLLHGYFLKSNPTSTPSTT